MFIRFFIAPSCRAPVCFSTSTLRFLLLSFLFCAGITDALAQKTYPSFLNFSRPSPSPGAPGDQFLPVMSGSPASNTPVCGEWNQTAESDQSLLITGYQFSKYSNQSEGKDTRFVVFDGQGFNDSKIQRLDSNKAIITLPAAGKWGMRLIWPENENGFGSPIAVNKTEAWWVGPNKAYKGDTISVFGTNLSRNNDSLQSYVFIKPTGGAGQWATVTKVNPYRVSFIVPATLANGSYEVWTHNGHGGEYGWSGPLTLTIQTKTPWNNSVFSVTSYGATGNGVTNDLAAIQAAINAATPYSTVLFPAGIYAIDNTIYLKSNVRYMGVGDASEIRCASNFSANSWGMMLAQNGVNNIEIANMTLNTNGNYRGNFTEPVYLRHNERNTLSNLRFLFQGFNLFDVNGSSLVFVKNCRFTGKTAFLGGASQLFIDSCDFKQTNDAEMAMHSWGGLGVSVTNSTSSDYDINSTTGWGMGRFFVGNGAFGSSRHTYLANNTTFNMGVRNAGGVDQNVGEQFMWEGNNTIWTGSASASTSITTTCPGFNAGPGKVRFAVIVKGKGLGQSRMIVGYSGSSITLEKPWNVIPDQTSVVNIGAYTDRVVAYRNYLDGKQSAVTSPNHTASAGIEPFGGCLNFIASGNTLHELRAGLANFVVRNTDDVGIQPTFFGLFVDNIILNCRVGIVNFEGNWNPALTATEGTGMLGIVYRKNRIESPFVAAMRSEINTLNVPVLDGLVFEYNVISNAPAGFQSPTLGTSNHIFYKNNFRGSSGVGIQRTTSHALRENVITGFSSPFSGTLAPVIEAPYHVISLAGISGGSVKDSIFALWNSGTSAMAWAITGNTSWLSLSPSSGNIGSQMDSSSIRLSADPAKLAPGNYTADIVVTSGSLSKTYQVRFVVANPTSNTAPTANAGNNQTIQLPVTEVVLSGTGTDPDGTIASYSWRKVSGTGGFIALPSSSTTQVTGLGVGTYVFRLVVTDNLGATDSADVTITVKDAVAPPNFEPAAMAGVDQVIQLPTSVVTVSGGGTDSDGSIVSFLWTMISGSGGVIVSPSMASTQITGLSAGIYVFRLTVTDNAGAIAYDDVQITVNPGTPTAPPANQPPVARAGVDQTIFLPVSIVSLDGSGSSDSDGSISVYGWSQVSGPSSAILTGANVVRVTVSNLVQGTYTFRLTVTDNSGGSATDDIVVQVNPAPPPPQPAPNLPPVARAGNDIRIVLPENSIMLDGSSSSDPDGTIVSWSWQKISGPTSYSMLAPNSPTTRISSLSEGLYEFELIVTDDKGARASGRVKVTVVRINLKPLALTADTIERSLPTANVVMSGADSYDPDGTIVSQKWTFKKGPEAHKAPRIMWPDSVRTIVADLVEGIYEFEYTVTDNDNATASKITVVRVTKRKNIQTNASVNLYPNPVMNDTNLTIESDLNGRTQLTILDALGRVVHNEVFMKDFAKISRRLNVSNLTSGIYFVNVRLMLSEMITIKMMKQ